MFLREDEGNSSHENHWVVALFPLNNLVDRQQHLAVTFQVFLQSLKLRSILQHHSLITAKNIVRPQLYSQQRTRKQVVTTSSK